MPSALDRRAGGQSLQAVAVERAHPFEWIDGSVVGDSNVAHLGVQQAMERFPFDQNAAANSCSDRHVQKGIQALRRTPPSLPQGSGIDIRLNGNRDLQGAQEGRPQVGVGPTGLGGRSDPAEAGGLRIEVDRAE